MSVYYLNCGFSLENSQGLKVIVPNVRYRPPRSQMLTAGVSVNLKRLLAACDTSGINNPAEKLFRRSVRQMESAISSGNQRFLPQYFPVSSDVSQIPRQNFSISKV